MKDNDKIYLPVFFANFLSNQYDDLVGRARQLWRDYSYWQGEVDAAVAIANGVVGIIHRASLSTGYKDPYFSINYEKFKGLTYRSSYHVIYPDQPVIAQLDNWYKVHPEIDIIPRVIDLEVGRSQPAAKIASATWAMSEEILRRDGHRPWLYSRKNLVDTWLASWTDSMLNSHYWWLAQYLINGYVEHSGPPSLPKRVKEENVILHQTSDKKSAPAGEVKSRAVDWNRWELGTYDQMNDFIDEHYDLPFEKPDPPQIPDEINPIDIVEVTASALNIRSLPDAGSSDIGTLKMSSDIPITEYAGDWGKIEGWINTRYTS